MPKALDAGRTRKLKINFFVAALMIGCISTIALASPDELPLLGDRASSYVSIREETRLGNQWLQQLRSATPTLESPLALQFLEELVYQLVPYSGIPYQKLQFVIVDNEELNAFAVPGGIVGVNYGLFLHTDDEDEFASVLAHELGHLGQRHFARSIEQSEQQTPVAIASFLASLLLIATNNVDAGIAGIMASQAASTQTRLSYSRRWEQEADRVGMETLSKAGMDPNAMTDMFRNMQQATRFNGNPPEFLLTHPLTANRVAEAEDRAALLETNSRKHSLIFEILKFDALMRYRLKGMNASLFFEEKLNATDSSRVEKSAALYSLTRLSLQKDDLKKARDYLSRIPLDHQQNVAMIILAADAVAASGNPTSALKAIETKLEYHPENFALLYTQGQLQKQSGQLETAVNTFEKLARNRPIYPLAWLALHEVSKKAKKLILAYHSYAEFLYLTGKQQQSGRMMDLAIEEAGKQGNFQQQEALRSRLLQMTVGARSPAG